MESYIHQGIKYFRKIKHEKNNKIFANLLDDFFCLKKVKKIITPQKGTQK